MDNGKNIYNIILRYGNHETFLRGNGNGQFSEAGMFLKNTLIDYMFNKPFKSGIKTFKSFFNEILSNGKFCLIEELDQSIDFLYEIDFSKNTAIGHQIRHSYFLGSDKRGIYKSVNIINL